LNIEELKTTLAETELVSSAQLDALLAELPEDARPADGEALLRLLIAQEVITFYQGQVLLRGKGRSLRLGNYVGLSLLLVRSYGILGVALGTALPNAAFAAVVLGMACKATATPLGTWLRNVALRPLLGALVPLAFLCALKYGPGVDGFVELTAAGIAMVALFALVWVLFVYRGDPYVDLRGRLAGLWRRVQGRSAG
jgi:hypothetical protein